MLKGIFGDRGDKLSIDLFGNDEIHFLTIVSRDLHRSIIFDLILKSSGDIASVAVDIN